MPLTLDQFSAQLTGGNLLPAEDVLRLREQHQPADSEQFARLLVKQKFLTAYQAQQAYAGKASSLVLGNYVLLDKLGQGGMGMVLKARHRRMNRIVALKILSPAVTKTPEAMKRFQREVEAAARLHHPNIVTAYDADEVKGTHFLVMEYVEGTDLSVLTKKKGPMPVDQAVTCVTQAARGLEFAHKHGIVHRDIKPANLLLDEQGTVKILDMGLARIEGETGSQAELTSTGAVMGTVDYMAPEQALNTKSADARSDVYSLGVTLWFLLTGRPVYEGDSLMARLIGHRESPIPSLRGVRGEVPAALDDLFRRMVAKQPQDRFQSMTEVLAALETCRSGTSITSTPSMSLGPSEESKLSEFIGIFGGVTDPAAPTRTAKSLRAAATEAASRAASVSSPYEATVTSASASEGTDPQTLTTLARTNAAATAPSSAMPVRSRFRGVLLVGSALALAAIAAVVLFPSARPQPAASAVPVTSVSPIPAVTPSDPEDSKRVIGAATSGPFALEFSGPASSVECPPPGIPGRELTVEAWVFTPDEDFPENRPVYQLGETSVSWNPNGRHWSLDLYRTDGQWDGVSSSKPAPLGEPTHVAATLSNKECRLFVNGRHQAVKASEVALGDIEQFFQKLARSPLWIGSRKMSPEGKRRHFPGQICEFRVSSNIRYREPFSPPATFESDPQTLALYRFEEGSGNVLKDSSGNGRDGKIVGASWRRRSTSSARLPASGNPSTALRLAVGSKSDHVELPSSVSFDDSRPGTVEMWILEQNLKRGPVLSLKGDQELLSLRFDASDQVSLVVIPEHVPKQLSQAINIVVPTRPLGAGPMHLAASWNGQGGYKLFVNGKKFAALQERPVEGAELVSSLIGTGSAEANASSDGQSFTVGEVRISDNEVYRNSFAPPRTLGLEDSTIALYRLNEGTGEVIRDASGHGHDARLVGGSWIARPDTSSALLDGAAYLSFDGVDDRVDLPPLPLAGGEGLTLEAVIELESRLDGQAAILRTNNSSLKVLGAEALFSVGKRIGEKGTLATTHTPEIPIGRPVHLAGVWDGNRLVVYVNGVPQGWNEDGRLGVIRAGSSAIGDHTNKPQEPFRGKIYRVRVSRTARYEAAFVPDLDFKPDTTTAALYRFDEGAGDVLKDSSGNGFDATIVGPKWGYTPKGAAVDLALDFDGKGYVQLPPIDFTKLDALTLEATVKVLYPPGKDPKGDPVGSYFSDKERYGLGLMAKERGLVLDVGTQVQNGTAGHEIVHSGPPWGKGPFQVAATVDRKGKSLAFYVGGRLIERKPLTGEFNGGPTPLMLGADPGLEGKANMFFAGQVDEVRISDNVRYTADYEPVRRFETDDHTLALYHCDEGSGDVLTDSSGHERHGRVVRAKWVATSALTGIRPPLPAAGTSPKSATDAAALDPVARLNSAGQDDAYPWLLPEALKVYFTREAEGLESATYSATRKSADEPFGTPRRELSGRMLVVTGDDLYGVLLPGNYGVGKTLFETSRSSLARPWGEPRPIASLAAFTNAKSPWISDDGLTLVFQRQKTTSPIAASSSEFVISRRASRMAAWGTPELLPMSPDPALDDVLTWPQLSPDQRTLCFCVGGTRAPRIFFATRSTSDGPFRGYTPVVVEGQPVTGRAPRWLSGRSELFLSRDPDAAVKDSNLQVIRGVRPKE